MKYALIETNSGETIVICDSYDEAMDHMQHECSKDVAFLGGNSEQYIDDYEVKEIA